MRIAALLFTAILAVTVATLGNPAVTYADPNGTQSASTVPFGGFVRLNVSGMDASSPLFVSYSVGYGDGWHTIMSPASTNARGSGEVVFTPLETSVDRNFQGFIWVQVCDRTGTCIVFTVTVGGSTPVIVGRNKFDQAFCDVFNAILRGRYPGSDPLFVLDAMGDHAVVQQALRCGFTETQIRQILDYVFGD